MSLTTRCHGASSRTPTRKPEHINLHAFDVAQTDLPVRPVHNVLKPIPRRPIPGPPRRAATSANTGVVADALNKFSFAGLVLGQNEITQTDDIVGRLIPQISRSRDIEEDDEAGERSKFETVNTHLGKFLILTHLSRFNCGAVSGQFLSLNF